MKPILALLGITQKFYEKAVAKLGWRMFAGGQGATIALLLINMKGSDTLSLSFIPQPNDVVYVMFVK